MYLIYVNCFLFNKLYMFAYFPNLLLHIIPHDIYSYACVCTNLSTFSAEVSSLGHHRSMITIRLHGQGGKYNARNPFSIRKQIIANRVPYLYPFQIASAGSTPFAFNIFIRRIKKTLPLQLPVDGHSVVWLRSKYAFNVFKDGDFFKVLSSFFHTYLMADISYDTKQNDYVITMYYIYVYNIRRGGDKNVIFYFFFFYWSSA
jgi:hypothetical protein